MPNSTIATATSVTIFARNVDIDRIETRDHDPETDLVATDIECKCKLMGPLDQMLAVASRVHEQLLALKAARTTTKVPSDPPVWALLDDDGHFVHLVTADGVMVGNRLRATIGDQQLTPGDSVLVARTASGWAWAGWPSAQEVDTGPGVDLRTDLGRHLVAGGGTAKAVCLVVAVAGRGDSLVLTGPERGGSGPVSRPPRERPGAVFKPIEIPDGPRIHIDPPGPEAA